MLKRKSVCKICVQLFDLHTLLRHGVAVTDRHTAVGLRVKIVGHAERRTDLILTTVAFTNIASVIILTVIPFRKLRIDFLRTFCQLLRQRKHTDLHRSQGRVEPEHRTGIVTATVRSDCRTGHSFNRENGKGLFALRIVCLIDKV